MLEFLAKNQTKMHNDQTQEPRKWRTSLSNSDQENREREKKIGERIERGRLMPNLQNPIVLI